MEVIEQLLAAPPAPERLVVRFVEVRGTLPDPRPWVRYEFADPALEEASAGQKIMLRVGPVNQRRLKARLAELRKELASRASVATR